MAGKNRSLRRQTGRLQGRRGAVGCGGVRCEGISHLWVEVDLITGFNTNIGQQVTTHTTS